MHLQELTIEEAKQSNQSTLELPSNYTVIREHVTDNFSCQGRKYGYYADVENECQVFHICLPVDYGTSRRGSRQLVRKWSFICPETTQFDQVRYTLPILWHSILSSMLYLFFFLSQAALTCNTANSMNIDCMESEMWYDQSEYEQQETGGSEYTAMKTMESTTARAEKTTSKGLLHAQEDLLRQSGVSQKIIQKLPAYIVQQSMNKLTEEPAAEQLEDVATDETAEISMPLIQLTEIEPPESVTASDNDVDTVDIGQEDIEHDIAALEVAEDNTVEVLPELGADDAIDTETPVEIKIGRKGFLFKADALKPKAVDPEKNV